MVVQAVRRSRPYLLAMQALRRRRTALGVY